MIPTGEKAWESSEQALVSMQASHLSLSTDSLVRMEERVLLLSMALGVPCRQHASSIEATSHSQIGLFLKRILLDPAPGSTSLAQVSNASL